ncbi:hypothetical protein BBJ28_00020129 [Nothophytophthora sp. Chile5]|nr:hypothetical protein BBJ28_00020129 [Nothophytophthora sp. Chile5]
MPSTSIIPESNKGKYGVSILDKKYHEDVVYPHLKWMHDARTQQQFEAFVDLLVPKSKEEGEGDYAQWFEDVYVAAPWSSWFVGVTGKVAGILPSQNSIESFHRAIKTTAVDTLRANTATVLNSTLLNVLKFAAMYEIPEVIRHYTEGK